MKRKIRLHTQKGVTEGEVTNIPVRYIIAIVLAVLETAAIIGIVIALCKYVPYFYLAVWVTEFSCVIKIIASNDNPDYKIPWLLFVLIIPIGGFMLYFLFYSRWLKPKFTKRLNEMKSHSYSKDDSEELSCLKSENPTAFSQAKMLCGLSESHLFTDTKQTYFPLGEQMHAAMLNDLKAAQQFIFMEYFIIEDGVFWSSILDILKEKAAQGVEVRVLYDDIGCMMTLPGNYFKTLRSYGINAVPFSVLKGNADSEFNNRSHRKIMVIDGRVGYTGGVNIADEYINAVNKLGHWKDIGIRLEGGAVKELTKLFLVDFGINTRKPPAFREEYYPNLCSTEKKGYIIPFGDGPKPIYQRRVGKSVIQNMLSQAVDHVYIMSPYLIIDSELCQCIENAALRGVDVRIITPHVPDKKLIFAMTRSYYSRLMEAGVTIYEYEPGFIHAKCYLADDEYAMVGTINLDNRSLAHHFENGVWMYRSNCIADIRKDFEDTFRLSIKMEKEMLKTNLLQRFICSLVKIFAPLL